MIAGLTRLLIRRRILVPLMLVVTATTAWAAWSVPGTGSGSAIASPDFHAPSVSLSTIAPVGMTALGGGVRAGGQFVVYANVTDPGGSGVASARADVSAIKAGSTSVALSPCVSSCTIGTKTYNWSSAPLTADAGLTQGAKTYGVWGTDNTGNQGSPTSFSVTVDNTAPSATAGAVVTASTTGAGWVAQGGSYIVYASATDAGSPATGIATVTASVTGITSGVTALSLPKCTTSCTVGGVTYGYKSATTVVGSPLAPGAVSFSVTSTDGGGSTATGNYSVTVDNTAPTVSAAVVSTSATSTPGFLKQGGTYIIYANSADGGAINAVTANVSGLTAGQTAVALTACTSSCTVGGVTYGYKSASKTADATIAEGPASFTITSTDKAANATTAPFSVTIDNTGAAVTQTTIANTTTNAAGWIRKSGAYAVYANVSDAASGIYTVKANVSSITSGQTALALSACTTGCTVGGVTYAYKSANKNADSTVAQGAVSYTLALVDKANNSSTGNGGGTADNTAPVFTSAAVATSITNVAGYLAQNRPYVVYGSASDAYSGLNTLTAKVNTLTTGQTALAMTACSNSCSASGVTYGFTSAPLSTNTTLSAGTKTYTLTATDLAGNALTSPSQSATVDNTAPTVTISYPTAAYASGWASGCSTAGVDDVCGTATDASAGIWQVQASFRQTAAPNLYWDGATGFLSAAEVLSTATWATPNWNLAMAASRFVNNTGYTIRAVSTDKSGNTASASTSFTFHP
jgi:hypothetical protein